MDAKDKIKKSADALGVYLAIPAFVDPNAGFKNEKIVKWENGDKIKVTVDWVDGAFYYKAFIGQIDPKTNELAFISGEIADTTSLETLIGKIDEFIKAHEEERTGESAVEEIPADAEPVEEPETKEVQDEVDPFADLTLDDIMNAYDLAKSEYQELLLDPVHDKDQVWEKSQKIAKLEDKLRENGLKPGDFLV